jgi:hypothetical protein
MSGMEWNGAEPSRMSGMSRAERNGAEPSRPDPVGVGKN